MVIPIYDGNPFVFRTPPYVSWGLIAANFAVFFWEIATSADINGQSASVLALAFRPDAVLATSSPAFVPSLPWEVTLVTYSFIHVGWLHILGNMAFLWVFGDDVEDALGHVRFLLFYLLCGVAGALAHFASNPSSSVPLLGASGAIAGVVAAYLMLHPCRKIWVLALARIPLKIAAEWALGFWIFVQILNAALSEQSSMVAWWTHIGGLAAGAILVALLRLPGVKLFDCDQDRVIGKIPSRETP
jgi:membrane associated rhomboid family serine protease